MFRFFVIFFYCTTFQLFAQDIDERCGLPTFLCELQLELESSDAELNRVYKAIMSSINTGELPNAALVDASELKQSLIISQRSWLEFKKKNCDAFYILQSGGMQRNEARLECEIEMTNARIKYLTKWY